MNPDKEILNDRLLSDPDRIRQILTPIDRSSTIYPDSIHRTAEYTFLIARLHDVRQLLIIGASPDNCGRSGEPASSDDLFASFSGKTCTLDGLIIKCCPLSVDNSLQLRKVFPFTNPVALAGRDVTIGLGDRLGLASPGHIRVMKRYKAAPVLAQQSIRELNLTGATFADVLAAAVWAVFQEGYADGYGADGDHLKTAAEVQLALASGFTMITLDCSEQIDNTVTGLADDEVDARYVLLDPDVRRHYESLYDNRVIMLDDSVDIRYAPADLKRIVLIYHLAILHAISIYTRVIKPDERTIDFELSIDETLTATSPESHYLVAAELIAAGVRISSLAPRFYGEFQKGVDYRGNLKRFTAEFDVHARIARHLGYRISVHSGSDKFSVFPIIGSLTGGRFHLKTAGTNWLEAMCVIAAVHPALYRRMHAYALLHLDEARKYYHVSCDTAQIPALDTLTDDELILYFRQNDSRQLIHITYGLLLQARGDDGSWLFRDEFYETLEKHETEYFDRLIKHIGRHLVALGLQEA